MNTIKGFLVSQNNQDFIVGKTTIKELLTYTKYTERLIIGYDEEDKPIYNNHIQRKVEESRISKISDFLIFDDMATFPTNIVLGIPSSVIVSQNCNEEGVITLTLDPKVGEEIEKAQNGDESADIFVTIIDGQHRIAGIERAIEVLKKYISKNTDDTEKYRKKLENLYNIDLVISCFIDKSIEYEAMIFSTINRTQKKVSQDLVHSLFGITENDSPYKTGLEITLALNAHPNSPFYKRIKLYGGSIEGVLPPLSQTTMIKNIVGFISESLKEAENDRFRKRSELQKQRGNKVLPFRSFYANNNDKAIADCLFYYFSSIKETFPDLWEYDFKDKPKNVLQSTVGFEALMKLLREIIDRYGINSFYKGCFDHYVSNISKLPLSDVNEFPMTTKGKKIMYNAMYVEIFHKDPSAIAKTKELEILRSESKIK